MDSKATYGKNRFERKKEKTREQIVSVAMKLFMEQGFDATTMEQIAQEADIAKGTLYNHFPVKEAILNEFIQKSFRDKNQEMIQRIRQLPDTRSRMAHVLTTLMAGIQQQPIIFERYIVYRIKNMIAMDQTERDKSGIGHVVYEIVALGQENDEIRRDMPLDLMEDLFEFIFIEVAQAFYKDPDSFHIKETIDRCVDLYLNGTKNRS